MVVTVGTIKELFWWHKMDEQIRGWVKMCLCCSVTRGGSMVLRPTLSSSHARSRMELLHFDFLKMPAGTGGLNYILVMKDDFSMFTQLEAYAEADADSTVESLMNWFSRYGIVERWQSDNGGHFKNKVMKAMAKKMSAAHHFTTAAAPWSNGTVEVVNSTVLKVFMALIAQYQMREEEWPALLPDVTYAINHTRVPRLAGYTPAQIFLGAAEGNPLKHFFRPPVDGAEFGTVLPSLTDAPAMEEAFAELVEALDVMHKEVAAVRHPEQRRREVERAVNFERGDWVQVARVINPVHTQKLTPTWQGPVVVEKVLSDYRYVVWDQCGNKRQEVHAARLRFYADGQLKLGPEILDHIAVNKGGYEVDRVGDYRRAKRKGAWEVEIVYCDGKVGTKWMPLKEVAKSVAFLLRAMTRRKEIRDRKDVSDFKNALDKIIPKQNRKAKKGPTSSGLTTAKGPLSGDEGVLVTNGRKKKHPLKRKR